MTDINPRAKRPRTSDSVAIENRTRDAKLWFEDGNIILTTKLTLFRVHRGVLLTNSSVFADMLSIPQPERDEDSFLGLPVVEMFDDDKDVTHFLHVLYDRGYYRGGSATTFEKISSLLRMSTKYRFTELRNEIISHLAIAYPATLEKYKTDTDPETQQSLFPLFAGQHFAVVTLARETDAIILLPAALWRSSCEEIGEILGGIVGPGGWWHRLSPDDILVCMRTKHYSMATHVLQDNHRIVGMFKHCENANSKTSANCIILACNGIIESSKCTVPSGGNQFGLYDTLVDWDPFLGLRPQFCNSCTKFVESFLHRKREKRWKLLPMLLELGEWEDIIQQACE
ncbi:hypothetical protein BD410DRAFT_748386 [Rickenella mellea]|uniref:BTB domain-containing protein n=1 Tax=Rickenella mellea TaxID=50990 RepID=A0A4Y7Q4P0_9AGAM|nr:hypothetical protein BD410DRAFT_748386 [Rickenella mellea]